MEMVELYMVLANGTKLLVVEDRYRYKYLNDKPIYQGDVYSIPVEIINRRIRWMITCIIDEEPYIICELD